MGTVDFWCEWAWFGGDRPASGVLVGARDGRIESIVTGTPTPPRRSRILRGLTLHGVANGHSHAFHRALRGRTHGGRGDFWMWREAMYRVASVLDPELYHRLARAVYAEMVESGYTAVGEFHYLHHPLGGGRYRDPNVMGEALIAAAAEAGIRLTLLDTLYLHGGLGEHGYEPLSLPQARFGDESAEAWTERVGRFDPGSDARMGVAAHSVRAVDPRSLEVVATLARERKLVVHLHLSEQPAENTAAMFNHGLTPTGMMARAGLLGRDFTAVHATHLSSDDIELLGSSESTVCMCPTTEADLGDGVGPSARLLSAGARLCVGSDSHAVVDPFTEARSIELNRRLVDGVRGVHHVTDLARALTNDGYRSLGHLAPDGGPWDPFAIGAPCDLVTVGLNSVRLAGHGPRALLPAVLFSATATDVTDVVIDARVVVAEGRHVRIDAAAELATVLDDLWNRDW